MNEHLTYQLAKDRMRELDRLAAGQPRTRRRWRVRWPLVRELPARGVTVAAR